MDSIPTPKYGRIAVSLLMVTALWGCGPGDDKGKDKKAEPAPPPKAAPAPAPAPAKKEEAKPKPEPKAATELPGGWKLLGQQQAGPKAERDRIAVGREKGAFNELQVIVQGAPLTIDEVIITLGNDRQIKPKIQKEFAANSSAVIDLPGKDNARRAVKQVEFVYRTAGAGKGRSTVLLYGR